MGIDTHFFGRKRELQMLQELFEKRTSSLVVIRGRRRIGKTRLIQEFSKAAKTIRFVGLPPDHKVSAQSQREEFARQLQQQLGIRGIKAEDWGDLFYHLAQHLQKGKIILVFDEINWMGYQDPTFLGKLKTAWDEYFKQNHELIFILSGSMSGWINENILQSTGFFGRVSLDITLDELPIYECNHFWEPYEKQITSYEKFKILSVTGGVPRYLEEINPKITAEENIHRLCFRKEGILFQEFDRIFTDLFGKRASAYKMIVKALSLGKKTFQELLNSIELSLGGTLTRYLHDLELTGYIKKEHTWSISSQEESKLHHYRLSDNYLRFYLKYIEPNKSKIEKNALFVPSGWDQIMGLQFENLVLNNRESIYRALSIPSDQIVYDNPFFQTKTKQRAGCQIDFLIQTKYQVLYFIEIKFSIHPIDTEVIEEVQNKMDRLDTKGKRFSMRPVLIHVNGVTPQLAKSTFFMQHIDFGKLLKNH